MKLWHVGVIVQDVRKAVEFYRSIPGAEDEWIINEGMSFDESEMIIGRPMTLNVAMGKVGGIGYELIEPVSNYSYQMDALKIRGEHIHHMAYVAGDRQNEIIEELLAQGHEKVWEARKGPDHIVFIKAKDGGMVFEILNNCPVPLD